MNENELIARLELALQALPEADYRSITASWSAGDGAILTLTLSSSRTEDDDS